MLNSALSTPPGFQFREMDIGGIEDINVYTERLSPSPSSIESYWGGQNFDILESNIPESRSIVTHIDWPNIASSLFSDPAKRSLSRVDFCLNLVHQVLRDEQKSQQVTCMEYILQ